jgi:hypothetical protein
MPADTNAAGAASDPFAYTMGSLLTPWTKTFTAPAGSGGGGAAPTLDPFHYGDFSFGQVNVGQFNAPDPNGYTPAAKFDYAAFKAQDPYQAANPFTYDKYQGPDKFAGPTPAELQADPSYQFRLKQGQGVLENSAAARGLLRTGGTMKGLLDYGQQAASQEYQAAYDRAFNSYQADAANRLNAYQTNYNVAAGSYDRNEANRFNAYEANEQNSLNAYQTNYGVASGNFDRNEANRFNAYQANFGNALNAYQANTNATLGAGSLNYQISSGAYDRNRQNALDQWNSAYQIQSAQASASNSASNRAYAEALDQYNREQSDFFTNQDRQYGKLMGMAALGQGSAGQLGALGSAYGSNAANLGTGAANAIAAGQVGGANAWAGAIQNSANTFGGLALAGAYARPNAGGGGGGTLYSGGTQPSPYYWG